MLGCGCSGDDRAESINRRGMDDCVAYVGVGQMMSRIHSHARTAFYNPASHPGPPSSFASPTLLLHFAHAKSARVPQSTQTQ